MRFTLKVPGMRYNIDPIRIFNNQLVAGFVLIFSQVGGHNKHQGVTTIILICKSQYHMN